MPPFLAVLLLAATGRVEVRAAFLVHRALVLDPVLLLLLLELLPTRLVHTPRHQVPDHCGRDRVLDPGLVADLLPARIRVNT